MLEEVVKDYAVYFKLDLQGNFQTVQDVIDNMIIRLEELTSVVKMIKQKNQECNSVISEDLSKYRNEIILLSKKVSKISEVIFKLQTNLEIVEKQVVRAEVYFGINTDSKLKNFLKPFFNRSREQTVLDTSPSTSLDKNTIQSVMDSFECEKV